MYRNLILLFWKIKRVSNIPKKEINLGRKDGRLSLEYCRDVEGDLFHAFLI